LKSLNPFEIPRLLRERELQKKRELEERADEDVQAIKGENGEKFTKEDVLDMHEADEGFLYTKEQQEDDDGIEEEIKKRLSPSQI